MDHPLRYVFHSHATAFGGRILDPKDIVLEAGGASALVVTGGRTVSRLGPTKIDEYFDSIGKNHEFFSPVGTDAISFNNVGIPASGVLTGQDCCKTQEEAAQILGLDPSTLWRRRKKHGDG